MKKFTPYFIVLLFYNLSIAQSVIVYYDGNTYNTIQIGNYEWFQSNLKVKHFKNGDPIPYITDDHIWANTELPAYCYYNHEEQLYNIYGVLYNWYAASDVRGICPEEWKIPSSAEWDSLFKYLGGYAVAANALKIADTIYWKSLNSGATNSSGFSAMPAGNRMYNGSTFWTLREEAFWWSSVEYSQYGPKAYSIYYNDSSICYPDGTKQNGYSLRCMRIKKFANALCNTNYSFNVYPNPTSDIY